MTLISEFAPLLISWQRLHGRHGLPWQDTSDPYQIWLSEVMLQQTQVSTVLFYYKRFISRFPSIESLANASLDEVMALWSGLGYYSRARNLHRCALTIMTEYNGVFPQKLEQLVGLPGIGPSTAAAIAAFAFGAREAILDGNVKRVLTRVFDIEGFPGKKQIEDQLWALAKNLLPHQPKKDEIKAYTQGLMDLGATICIRGKPLCERCPFTFVCRAKAANRQLVLPTPRPKKIVPTRRTYMLILRHSDSVLLYRRPDIGIWGGLWSLPEAENEEGISYQGYKFGICEEALETKVKLSLYYHAFTHFKLEIEPRLVQLEKTTQSIRLPILMAAQESFQWVKLNELDSFGMPAPVKRILNGLDLKKD